jgi:uncharacterized protein YndB with AHSA1/START domain
MLHEASFSSPARLVLEGQVDGASPEDVTRHFTEPELVTTWWAEHAEVDAAGSFIMRWPAQEWTLRGRFIENDPGRRVRFTWHWDHEPLVPVRTVLVTTAPTGGGTQVTVTHGDYGPDDADERQGHAEGWQYFFGRLAAQFG